MKIKQVLGRTYCLEDWLLIPLYLTDGSHAILLDCGDIGQREKIEEALRAAHIVPVGIINTHAHTDHSPNDRYFQEKYQIPVAMPLGEAGISATQLNLKSYFYMLSPEESRTAEDVYPMEVTADRILLPQETEMEFCGARFGILHTPGHSPDHIAIRTPDDALYLGDALLTGKNLTETKLPYFFSIETAIETLERLKTQSASCYIAAHRGLYSDIGDWIERDIDFLHQRSEELRRLIDHPMTVDEIYKIACLHYGLLSANPRKAALYERNIRVYVEYLRDRGRLRVWAEQGLVYYGPVG